VSRFAFAPTTLFILIAVADVSSLHLQSVDSNGSRTCVEFDSGGPLVRGDRFRQALPRDLEFRLTPYSDATTSQWTVEVGPTADPQRDFLWIVSPPWRTAPHRQIGAGYGLTARDSMQLSRRSLRFVLTSPDYGAAMAVYDAVGRNEITDALERLDALGKGTLDFVISGFDIRKREQGTETEILEWVTFKAVACVPKS
jgi:hypothetical protein